MKKALSLFLILSVLTVTTMFSVSCEDKAGNNTTTAAPTENTSATIAATEAPAETEVATEAAPSDVNLQAKVDVASVTGDTPADGAGLESAVNIFDGDSSTKWCVKSENITAQWSMTEAVTVNYYYFTTANDSPERNPASWVLYGSADGNEWTELSKVEGATLPTDFFTDSDTYTIENPQSFQFYKLNITAVATPGNSLTQFSEFNFFQKAQ